MKEKKLFREAVIIHKRNQHYGTVSINVPLHYSVLTLGCTIVIIFLVLFLLFGEFSEKFIVRGYLNSTKGLVCVYPKANGVIVRSMVNQGNQVKKGDELFLIDTSFEGLDKQNTEDEFMQLLKRKKAIEKAIQYKVGHLQALKQLLVKKYIALTVYNEAHEALIVLEETKNRIEMDLIKYKQTRSYVIHSPVDGVISSVIYKEGQTTKQSKPLLKILPQDADLIAELFIPVKQSGFLTKGNKIIIRYDAYPYERFGSYHGVIKEISQSLLTDEEEEKPIVIGQPYYKISAQLNTQFVRLYGKEKRVRHGMTISAVIVDSKRKIRQWILDPLYSFYGGLV